MSWEVHFVWITLSFSLIRLSNYICLQSSKTIYVTQLRGKFCVTIVITLGLDTSLFPVLISCTSVENALSCKRMIWSWDCSIRSRSARSGSCSNRFWCIRNDFNPAALRVSGRLFTLDRTFPLSSIINMIKHLQLTVLELNVPDAQPVKFVAGFPMSRLCGCFELASDEQSDPKPD